MDAASELLKLAEEKFGKLTKAEEKLFRAAANSEMADYSSKSKKANDPANAAKWGPRRVLLADRIAWLCTDKQASQLVTHFGIHIKGVRIDEKFNLLYAKIPFPLGFKLCKFAADIDFRFAQIGALHMSGTRTGFISANGLKVPECIFLGDGFRAEGEVHLRGAVVGGDLDCGKGEFSNKDGTALSADGLKVGGSVFLCDGFKAEGEVLLRNAIIDGAVDCSDGHFVNEHGRALTAGGSKVGEHVFFRSKFSAKGTVSLVAASIRGIFFLGDVDSPEEMVLDLTSAKIGKLFDVRESWLGLGRLLLHGMEYGEIVPQSPTDAETRIVWLRLQDGFSPQPYEHLAKVLRERGDGAGARDVLVAKNKDKAERTELTRAEWFWYRFFGPLIGYGHKPWLALRLALVIILFGLLFFKQGYSHGLVTPPSDSAYTKDGNAGIPAAGDTNRRISEVYPVFNSLVYSIDVFVPIR
jgi:hypothetical protein